MDAIPGWQTSLHLLDPIPWSKIQCPKEAIAGRVESQGGEELPPNSYQRESDTSTGASTISQRFSSSFSQVSNLNQKTWTGHLFSNLYRNVNAVIIMVAYGYQVAGNDDPLVKMLDDAFKIGSTITVPGRYLVEFIPSCEYHPPPGHSTVSEAIVFVFFSA